jgi:hypothetical protein
MKCRDCGKELPEVPVLYVGKRKPLCWEHFRQRRSAARRSWVRKIWRKSK